MLYDFHECDSLYVCQWPSHRSQLHTRHWTGSRPLLDPRELKRASPHCEHCTISTMLWFQGQTRLHFHREEVEKYYLGCESILCFFLIKAKKSARGSSITWQLKRQLVLFFFLFDGGLKDCFDCWKSNAEPSSVIPPIPQRDKLCLRGPLETLGPCAVYLVTHQGP